MKGPFDRDEIERQRPAHPAINFTRQFIIDEYGDLVVWPTAIHPYLIGSASLGFLGMTIRAALERQNSFELPTVIGFGLLWLAAAAVFIVPRLLGYPRMRVSDQYLVMQRLVLKPTVMDLARYGAAFGYSMGRSTYVGFRPLDGVNVPEPAAGWKTRLRTTAPHLIDVTAIAGLDKRKAEQIAEAINRYRPTIPGISFTPETARSRPSLEMLAWALFAVALVLLSMVPAILKTHGG